MEIPADADTASQCVEGHGSEYWTVAGAFCHGIDGQFPPQTLVCIGSFTQGSSIP
jgi:hypothetical protein